MLFKMLIVLAPPSVADSYYKKYFTKMVDFYISYFNSILGHDDVIIIADKNTMPYFQSLPSDNLLLANICDPWIRDVSPVIPSQPIQFKYVGGLPTNEARSIQKVFDVFANLYKIEMVKTHWKLDGGNVVDNNSDKAVITDKFLKDNKLTFDQGQAKLEELLDVKYVAIIPADEPKLGHSDGMVCFLDENTLGICDYQDKKFKDKVHSALKRDLPDAEIIEIPCKPNEKIFKGGFASASGIYVNCVVTENFIYMPTFGDAEGDEAAAKVIQEHSKNKQVITVDAQNVCFMGGSLRCLSWQIEGENAKKLIEAAKLN